jgi:hypothetical protein
MDNPHGLQIGVGVHFEKSHVFWEEEVVHIRSVPVRKIVSVEIKLNRNIDVGMGRLHIFTSTNTEYVAQLVACAYVKQTTRACTV